MTSHAGGSSTGFTLIELLIAVALLAIMTPLAYRGLASVTSTSERVHEEIERWQAFGLCFERVRTDVSQAMNRPVQAEIGGERAAWLGTEDQVEFTRAASLGHPPVRVAYGLADGKFNMKLWPVLDRLDRTVAEQYVLIDKVDFLRLRYLDGTGNWQPQWSDSNHLPAAIRLEIQTDDGLFHRIFALP